MSTEAERIAILETRFTQIQVDQLATNLKLANITEQLDQLLTLKDKGMGALWLVGLLASSGIIGIIYAVWNAFR